MHYKAELEFLKKFFKNLHINTSIICPKTPPIPEFDLGLRRMISNDINYDLLISLNSNITRKNIIYRIHDEFFCNYICIQLPSNDIELSHLVIGPYTTRNITKTLLFQLTARLSLTPKQFKQLQKYYTNLITIPNEDVIFSIVTTFGECLWGGLENFSVETIDKRVPDSVEPIATRPDFQEPEEALLTMQILEKRYEAENELIHAVSQGLIHKAEMVMMNKNFPSLEQRVSDPVRDIKNYCIIMNTLLRKGAEQGFVHPLHIDSLSSRFARKIEQVTSPEGGQTLQKEMIHKYCLLVKNHSMKGFSLLVQKVVTRIDSDLTADLSLKTHAKLLNVNASYLSTLFRKETGITLTDYVNKKRIENAVFLLNSTNMQIQTIAQHCGIPDVNYFTKLFKKFIGKTPKEYKNQLS